MKNVTNSPKKPLAKRFRGFLPVIVDVETAGFNSETDALLELAAVTTHYENEQLVPHKVFHVHIAPFEGAHLCPKALEFNKIDPFHPFRFAQTETEALSNFFSLIFEELKNQSCQRAVLVAHNAFFDMSFLQAAVKRADIKKSPFHQFTTFDTATLSGLAVSQTVLAKACRGAGIAFDAAQAHSALYDAERTAELFCWIVNKWDRLQGL
jgi:ribonuclease T